MPLPLGLLEEPQHDGSGQHSAYLHTIFHLCSRIQKCVLLENSYVVSLENVGMPICSNVLGAVMWTASRNGRVESEE